MDVFEDVKSALTDHMGKHSLHRYYNSDAILKCDCLRWTSLSAEHFGLLLNLLSEFQVCFIMPRILEIYLFNILVDAWFPWDDYKL